VCCAKDAAIKVARVTKAIKIEPFAFKFQSQDRNALAGFVMSTARRIKSIIKKLSII